MELLQVLVCDLLSRHANDFCEGSLVKLDDFIVKEICHRSNLLLIVEVTIFVDFLQLGLQLIGLFMLLFISALLWFAV